MQENTPSGKVFEVFQARSVYNNHSSYLRFSFSVCCLLQIGHLQYELNFFPPQPVEEVSKEREEEKVKEIQEDKSDEAAKRETKEVQTNELKAEKASQKATKKTRTVQCKVTLLGGTEYSCDLEVRLGAGRRTILMCGMTVKVSYALICGLAQ